MVPSTDGKMAHPVPRQLDYSTADICVQHQCQLNYKYRDLQVYRCPLNYYLYTNMLNIHCTLCCQFDSTENINSL